MEPMKCHNDPFAGLPGVTTEEHIEAKTDEVKHSRAFYIVCSVSVCAFFVCIFFFFYFLRQFLQTGNGFIPCLVFVFFACISLSVFRIATEEAAIPTSEQYILRFNGNVPATTIAFLSKNCTLEPIDDSSVFWRAIPKQKFLMYGKPQPGRINPPDMLSQDLCPLCSLTFDTGDELMISLRKDGYGDCSFCPKCGRKLIR